MGLAIPSTFASVAFVHRERLAELGTEPFVWTIGLKVGSNTADIQVMLNDLMDAWDTNVAPQTSDTISLYSVEATVPAVGGGTGTIQSTADPVDGTRADDPCYVAFAPKMRKVTAQVGRKYRGVFHPPGMLAINEVTSSGAISPTRMPQISAAFDDLAIAMQAITTFPPYLLHTGAEAPTEITAFLLQPKVGVLRDRML